MLVSTGDNPLDSGLLHFLAVLGIDANTHRLRTAKNYSYMLAGVVYCMRVLSVEQLLPYAHRNAQTDQDREHFLQQREKYLADGSHSPMSEALSLLAYSKHVALQTSNAGNAYWSKDKKIFCLHGQPIYLTRFCKMAQDMVAEVEQKMWEELFWVARAEDRFAVKLEQLVDDITFEQRGVSFVHHPANGLKDKLEWMLTQVEQTQQGRRLQSSGQAMHVYGLGRMVPLLSECKEIVPRNCCTFPTWPTVQTYTVTSSHLGYCANKVCGGTPSRTQRYCEDATTPQ
jgi:hypothetical protein